MEVLDEKISSFDFPKGRLTGYYSNMDFSLDCLATTLPEQTLIQL
jgi:hypothetical protein